MHDTLSESLRKLKWFRIRKQRMTAILLTLSLLVCLDVFWILRQPGLTLAGNADCGIPEHTHDEACSIQNCICGQSEELHIHTPSCYAPFTEVPEEPQPVCGQTDPLHEHMEACYREQAPQSVLVCGLSEIPHMHEDSCYERILQCQLPEHVHTIGCYADENADVETPLDWQAFFADYPYTGNLQEDLVGIAQTQVGYSESLQNFTVGEDGIRRGYTRYGAWYGTPYSDWSATFVSFCLHYAGADPDAAPGNTGADSMAELWKKENRYIPAGEYIPTAGDLVFFTDNSVGIVVQVQNATFHFVGGDKDGTVAAQTLALTQEDIRGWGSTAGIASLKEIPSNIPEPETEITPDQTEPSVGETQEPDFLDISNGPAVFLFAGSEVPPRMQVFAFRSSRSATDLLPYLKSKGGSYFFTLLDFNNQELPKDAAGNYIVQANTGYKLTTSFNSPEGFLPGTYQYQIPNGLMVDGGEGTFVLKDGTTVGTWTVTDTGLITLVFNENMNSRTDITISATMGIHFPEQEEPIDFDGKISVKVEKPPQQMYPTVMNKWGHQGGTPGAAGTDPSKIYWGIEIIGNKDSQIPGSILTDRIIDGEWSKIHRFTESDMAAGITFGVSDSNGGWHSWTVSADDPHLIWTETGWSYKMPKTATCQWCGELELGNEGWYYYINYSSTPKLTGVAGSFGYENDATVDGAYGYAWVNFTQGDATGTITKNGSFVSDASDSAFLWEFQATIPGRQEGKRADYHWYIKDNMKLMDSNVEPVGPTENHSHLATVTTTYNGATIQVPRIQDATDADLFAWDIGWTETDNGITHGRVFNLLSRCRCTAETCHWESGCGEYWFKYDDGTSATKGFCQCWTATEEMTFTFVYETDDLSIIETYGGLGYHLQNVAELFYIPPGSNDGALVDSSKAIVPIPGLFKKELTHDFNGYTANYKVTINEAKLVLTDGTPLIIHDVMTETLAYISGSLVITAEDTNGNITTLRQGTDYTVTYDGTGSQKDDAGNRVHVLDIVIQHPQPVMYTLDYDTTLIIPSGTTQAVKYSNSATITLWGEDLSDTSAEKVYADINIAAKNYKVEIFKTAARTDEPLSNAMFGLYNAQDGLISTDITDNQGRLIFQTNIIEGIVLREHVLYYMQELKAPPGYQLDQTKYWFCFCNSTAESCATCREVMDGVDAIRIPLEQIEKVHIVNEPLTYNLPATGGSGIYPLMLASVMFVITPLVYGFLRRRKQERRGVG